MQYVADTAVTDTTPPPAPRRVRLRADAAGKTELVWEAEADPESGLAGFVVERDGTALAKVPEQPVNPFGRPLFQNLQYSDTPTQPLVEPRFVDSSATPGMKHVYRVRAVNTTGLESPPSEPAAVSP
jgi:hypothetical protein